MTNQARGAVVALVVLALVAPGAVAHGPPKQRDYETRLLADCVDDYFGGDAVSGEKEGHDLVSLDVQEQFDTALQADVLRFHFIMNGGFGTGDASSLKEELKFSTPAGAKTLTLSTSNNEAFTGSFDRIEAPRPLVVDGSQDGSRFYVDAIARLSSLGLAAGQKLSGFTVTSYVDNTRRDYMPGTYDGALIAPSCTQGGGAPYTKPDYTIRGPSYYAKLTAEPATTTLSAGGTKLISLDLENLLKESAQTFTLTATPPEGLTARFHDPSSGSYSDTGRLDLTGGSSGTIHLELKAESGSGGATEILLSTSLGGTATSVVTATVGGATPTGATTPTQTTSAGTQSSTPESGGNGIPGAGWFLATVCLLAAAWGRRQTK